MVCDACLPRVDWSEKDLAKHHMSIEWQKTQQQKAEVKIPHSAVVVSLADNVSLEAANRICTWLSSEIGDSIFQKYVMSVKVMEKKR